MMKQDCITTRFGTMIRSAEGSLRKIQLGWKEGLISIYMPLALFSGSTQWGWQRTTPCRASKGFKNTILSHSS
ncbi:hypothetical protein D3C78_1337240 [compost metagenome]